MVGVLTPYGPAAPKPARKRKRINWVGDLAAPHAVLNTIYITFIASRTGTLPIISETGAVNSGTIALPRKKTDRLRISSVLEGKPRSSPIVLKAGATVAEDMELNRLYSDIGTNTIHFFLAGQFLGLS